MCLSRVSDLVRIESMADFSHFWAQSSVRQSDVDSDSIFVISWLCSEMIEFVGACDDLTWDWDDFIRVVLVSNFGVDGGVETVDESSVFCCCTGCLYSSTKHCNKKIRTLIWRRNIWVINMISNDQKYAVIFLRTHPYQKTYTPCLQSKINRLWSFIGLLLVNRFIIIFWVTLHFSRFWEHSTPTSAKFLPTCWLCLSSFFCTDSSATPWHSSSTLRCLLLFPAVLCE